MSKTTLAIENGKFVINGKLTYSESQKESVHGLLMNARFIQGIFDDHSGRERYARFLNKSFDPEKNTQDLIKALPEWYRYGLRAFTVGMQGGGPCFTINNETIINNPFGEDGTNIDKDYLLRLERLIKAADEINMVVIVSLFYGTQAARLKDDRAVVNAVKLTANWLRDMGYTNVIIEIANEHDINPFRVHPILVQPEGIVSLMDIVRKESGGMPVGCSGGGGYFNDMIAKNSDVILIHGNGQTRQQYYNLIQKCLKANPNAPVVCNEDSQCISRMEVALKTGTSWGYYNNFTKQEPPADWSITRGEDEYFAVRMARILGIDTPDMQPETELYFQGLKANETTDGKRWLRVAALYPEKVDYVDFYRDGKLFYTSYDEPFTIRFESPWYQSPIFENEFGTIWEAVVHMTDGEIITLKEKIEK